MASVIQPRVEEILELTLNELRRSGFPEEVLTSGIVLTGGASLLRGMVELAEEVFNLPVRIGVPPEMPGLSERVRNPRYSTVIGLLQAAKERNLQQGHIAAARQPERRRPIPAPKPVVDLFDPDEGRERDGRAEYNERIERDYHRAAEPVPQQSLFARIREWINKTL